MTTKGIREKLDYEPIIENMIRRRTRDKLGEIKEYYEEIERKFEIDKERISKRYTETTARKEIDPELLDRIGEDFAEEHYIIDKLYLKTFRFSTIITIYSFLEIALNDLCNYLYHEKEFNLTLNDLRGKGVERSKLYLMKVCSVAFPETSCEWQEITKLNKIRNCIVHAEGDIEDSESPTKIRNIIENTEGIYLESDRFIQVESSYILSTIINIDRLLEAVYEESFKTVQ